MATKKVQVKFYASQAEMMASAPPDKMRHFIMSHGDTPRYFLAARGLRAAVHAVAKREGWSCKEFKPQDLVDVMTAAKALKPDELVKLLATLTTEVKAQEAAAKPKGK